MQRKPPKKRLRGFYFGCNVGTWNEIKEFRHEAKSKVTRK